MSKRINGGPQAGKTYTVKHSRKGTFTMRVLDVAGEWVHGVIVAGRANAMLEYNERETGEDITVRDSLCHFTEVVT